LGSPEIENERLREIDIERILPNSHQPRKHFDQELLNELATSIRAHGVVQPIIVRPLEDGFFQLIAGERRWRASQLAGLSKIPAVVRASDEHAVLEIALVENLQREDLNPMEEAQAYERLISEFGLTQEDVARRVGKSRATIANMLRLLRLPPEVQDWLRENRLTTGHAKALLSLSDLSAVVDTARKIIQTDCSVRQAEMLVARHAQSKAAAGVSTEPEDPNVKAAIRALEQVLGTKVTIQEQTGTGRGKI